MSDQQTLLVVENVERRRVRVDLKPENAIKLRKAASASNQSMSQFIDGLLDKIEIKG